MDDWLLTADLAILDSARWLQDAAVRIRNGRIDAVGQRRDLASSRLTTVALGRSVLCPGLVNAHTHLALSELAALRPSRPDFGGWVDTMVAAAGALDRPALARGYQRGIDLSLNAGTTAVGDIVPIASRDAAASSPLAGTRFLELLGFRRTFAEVAPHRLAPGEGLAPHAPYSTSAAIYQGAAELAASAGVRLALHVAESPAEVEFTTRGTGPLRDLLARLGRLPPQWTAPGVSPVRWIAATGALGPTTLAIHASHASVEDLALLVETSSAIIACPRSNLALTGRCVDLPSLLASGARVGLGTDSLASSPTLSILDEMRTVRQLFPTLETSTILGLATAGGAAALGLDAGTLTPGLRADLCAFPWPGDATSPFDAVLAAEQATAVIIGGRLVRGPGCRSGSAVTETTTERTELGGGG